MNRNTHGISFIPRPEFQVFTMELPVLSKREKEQAVANRLRGIFPGKLEDKYLVTLPNGKRGSYSVFVFDESRRGDPLCVSTLAAAKLCKKGIRYCVIAWDDWIEYIVLEDGNLVSSMVGVPESLFAENVDAEYLAFKAAEQFGLSGVPAPESESSESIEDETPNLPLVEVFCSASMMPVQTSLKTAQCVVHFTALETALAPFSRSAWACYPERLPEVKRKKRVCAALLCAAGIALLFLLRSWYAEREAAMAERREAERRIALEAAERQAKEEKYNALLAAWEEQTALYPVGVYRTIETLASCVSPAIRLVSAAIHEDGSFTVEGTTRNALAALEDLLGHPDIRDAEIGTIVWDAGIERFTLGGTVLRRPPVPEENLTIEEKIAWYEEALGDHLALKAMPDSAAAAARLIRDLLERNRLGISRFRYLEEQGGWGIECAVSGSGMQVVQALKDADDHSAMRVTVLESRNRQGGVDATLTVFVYGPGEEKRRRDYETHPSLARIAALYGILPGRVVSAPPAVETITETRLPAAPPASVLPSLLEYVGFIGIVDGRHYIYAKDSKSGELYRLAEGEGSYSYRINSAGLIVARLEADSSPVEVRRNDGF